MASEPLRVRGGATIPTELGWLVNPYPGAWLEADSNGVTVGDSWGFLTLIGMDGWTVAWAELEAVEVAGRSVRLVPREGRSCRFFSFSAKRVRAIEEAALLQGVPTQRILTTLLMYSWPRRRRARP